jgi:hypothetical protein
MAESLSNEGPKPRYLSSVNSASQGEGFEPKGGRPSFCFLGSSFLFWAPREVSIWSAVDRFGDSTSGGRHHQETRGRLECPSMLSMAVRMKTLQPLVLVVLLMSLSNHVAGITRRPSASHRARATASGTDAAEHVEGDDGDDGDDEVG